MFDIQGRIQGGGSLGAYEPLSDTKKFIEAIVVGRELNLVSFGVLGRKGTHPHPSEGVMTKKGVTRFCGGRKRSVMRLMKRLMTKKGHQIFWGARR